MRISDWSSDVCSSDLPVDAASRTRPFAWWRTQITGSDGIAGSSTTARWNVTADFGHCRGSVSTGTCDYGFSRKRIDAFSPPFLLLARRDLPLPNVAGIDHPRSLFGRTGSRLPTPLPPPT